jgi:hypothetical protein
MATFTQELAQLAGEVATELGEGGSHALFLTRVTPGAYSAASQQRIDTETTWEIESGRFVRSRVQQALTAAPGAGSSFRVEVVSFLIATADLEAKGWSLATHGWPDENWKVKDGDGGPIHKVVGCEREMNGTMLRVLVRADVGSQE